MDDRQALVEYAAGIAAGVALVIDALDRKGLIARADMLTVLKAAKEQESESGRTYTKDGLGVLISTVEALGTLKTAPPS